MKTREIRDDIVYGKLIEMNIEWHGPCQYFDLYIHNEVYFQDRRISEKYVKQALRRLVHKNLVKLVDMGPYQGYKFTTPHDIATLTKAKT